MVTEERGTSKIFAKNAMQASFARPSTGGAVKANFNASPNSPVIAFFLARGCILTAKVVPAIVSRMGIMNSDFTTESQSHRVTEKHQQSDFADMRNHWSHFLRPRTISADLLCDSVSLW
jgi:hypothetical protein